jgi:hypothetical protein
MTNHHDQERERLSQASILSRINKDLSLTEMLTVYNSDRNESHRYSVYCALVPNAMVEETFTDTSWDLMLEEGLRGTIGHYEQGIENIVYYCYGNDRGIEALVIERCFLGIRPNYFELSEEFRHFHNLYHDRTQDHFLKFDDNRNEELVAIIETNRVQIRLKEIRQFLASKNMHLSIQFDFCEFSTSSLEDLSLQEGGTDTRDGYMYWGLYYEDTGRSSSGRTFSRSCGKRLIQPLFKSRSRVVSE